MATFQVALLFVMEIQLITNLHEHSLRPIRTQDKLTDVYRIMVPAL